MPWINYRHLLPIYKFQIGIWQSTHNRNDVQSDSNPKNLVRIIVELRESYNRYLKFQSAKPNLYKKTKGVQSYLTQNVCFLKSILSFYLPRSHVQRE